MNWEIEIEKVDNGYTAKWWDYANDGGEAFKHRSVFEEEDTETGELDCMVKLLHFIKEHFGLYGSKHDSHLLRIEVVKNEDMG